MDRMSKLFASRPLLAGAGAACNKVLSATWHSRRPAASVLSSRSTRSISAPRKKMAEVVNDLIAALAAP